MERYEQLEKPAPNWRTIHDEIENAYSMTLEKWVDARGDLSSDAFHLHLQDLTPQRNKALFNMMKRMRVVKRITIGLEIVAPLAFAIIVLTASWLPLHKT